jgi:hypothetical protein
MKEELVDFETAILAKEKGFTKECLWVYEQEPAFGRYLLLERKHTNSYNKTCFSAPTQLVLLKWLYYEGIDVNIKYSEKDNLFEESLEKALKRGLKKIKRNFVLL